MQLSEQLQTFGYDDLNEMQAHAVNEGFLTEQRVLLSAPTASGKTLLAMLSIAKCLEEKKKAVYVVPLRALASEKYNEFSRVLKAKVSISTGDYDTPASSDSDVIIVTVEKLDSTLRHDPEFLGRTGLFVFDEVHLLNDDSRGATMEIVLTKVLRSGLAMKCLSATVPNAEEIAKWLGAKLITSKWRPTKLEIGVCNGKTLKLAGKKTKVQQPAICHLATEALRENNNKGQLIVFTGTRKGTQATAQELTPIVATFLSKEEKQKLAELSERILKALPTPTSQCKLLAECVRNGVAFHHAGIETKQRELIERGFKQERCIKIITATTTLAMGVDYPASWVIVRDLKRFNGAFSSFIPALECAQMLGRAGRPRFDDHGTAVMICKPEDEMAVFERYVYGPLEEIGSKLAYEPVLRTHCLSLIASGYSKSFADLFNFFNSSFYAYQYGSTEGLLGKVENVITELKEIDFLREKQSALVATPIGKRVSELYIDPLTAHAFIEFIHNEKHEDFGLLMALHSANEAKPLLGVKRTEEKALWDEYFNASDEPETLDALARYKTSKLVNAWINEANEDTILEDFDVPPGVLHARVRIMEWLAYAMQELSFLENATDAYGKSKNMRRRIKHGIKAELLSLTKMKGVGRVRARKLYNAGIKTMEEAESRPKEEIKKIIGSKE